MGTPDKRCILDNPETDCIKSPNEQLAGLQSSGALNTDTTAMAFGAAFKYVSSLVDMDEKLIKNKCGDYLGNKFLYEYGKCKDENGNLKTRYKYIDASCDGKNSFLKSDGLIPCTLNSAIDVGGSAIGIPKAIFEDATPDCEYVPVQCKVSNKGSPTFTGTTNAYIANADYGGKDNPAPSGFQNLYESVNDYMKSNDLDFNNIEKDINSESLREDKTLNEIYYVMLMIFLLFIIYKLLHKK